MTLYGYFGWWQEGGRGSGRTTHHIMALLPDTILLVPSFPQKRWTEERIKDLRGGEFAKSIIVQVVERQEDFERLHGQRRRLTADHYWFEHLREMRNTPKKDAMFALFKLYDGDMNSRFVEQKNE